MCFFRSNGYNPIRAKGFVRATVDEQFEGKECD